MSQVRACLLYEELFQRTEALVAACDPERKGVSRRIVDLAAQSLQSRSLEAGRSERDSSEVVLARKVRKMFTTSAAQGGVLGSPSTPGDEDDVVRAHDVHLALFHSTFAHHTFAAAAIAAAESAAQAAGP